MPWHLPQLLIKSVRPACKSANVALGETSVVVGFDPFLLVNIIIISKSKLKSKY
jgi:hypothetical protein